MKIVQSMVVVVAIGALSGCGDDEGGPCEELSSRACTCEDGRMGSQTCRSDGTYARCLCGAEIVDMFEPEDAGADAFEPSDDMGTPVRDLGVDLGRDFGLDLGLDFGLDMARPGCGDGLCQAGEHVLNCPEDCGERCGDGYCTTSETATSCPRDCDCRFSPTDRCAADAQCVPAARDEMGVFHGECTPIGTTLEGGACATTGMCEGALLCVEDRSVRTCEPVCDPLGLTPAVPSCRAGETCLPTAEVAGFCDVSCVPFTTTGCGAGQWCKPTGYNGDDGFCGPDGPSAVGAPCAASADCAEGSLCNGTVCVAVCDVDAPDACGADATCLPYEYTDASGYTFLGHVGECLETCDYDADPTCSSGVCIASEASGQPFDYCFDIPEQAHGTACAASAGEFSFCNGLGACFDVGESTFTCLDLCRLSEGPAGAGHPDCPTGTVCNLAAGASLGLCQ